MLQTLVAEVYGPDYKGQIELAAQIKKVFQHTPGVVDVDWYVEDPQAKYDLKVDLDKASLHGISAADVTRTLQVGLGGADAGLLHDASFAGGCSDPACACHDPIVPHSGS